MALKAALFERVLFGVRVGAALCVCVCPCVRVCMCGGKGLLGCVAAVVEVSMQVEKMVWLWW